MKFANRIQRFFYLLFFISVISIKGGTPCDTAKINDFLRHGDKSYDDGDINRGHDLYLKAREFVNAKECENIMAKIYLGFGRFEMAKGEKQKAGLLLDSSMTLALKYNNEPILYDATIRRGVVYLDNGQFEKALELYYKSLNYFEKTKDPKRIGDAYQRIGVCFKRQNRYADAEEYYRKALKIATGIKNWNQMTSIYSNISSLKYTLGDVDSAIHYLKITLEVGKNAHEKRLLLKAKLNMAAFYIEKKRTDESMKIFAEVLEEAKKEKDIETQAFVYTNLGEVMQREKDHKKAVEYFKKAINVSNGEGHVELQLHVLNSIVGSYSVLKDYKNAFIYLNQFKTINDSIQLQKNSKKTIEMKLQNEYERKTMADSLKSVEDRKMNEIKLREEETKRNYSYVGIIVLIIVIGIVLNRFRITQRQKGVIELQKKEVERQKHIVDEKQKEIVDSINYAKRIQTAIIPSKATLKKNFENHFLFYKPKDIVAGDFYWCETIGNTKLVAVADCTGHGVPGALVSVVCSNALNRAVKEFNLSSPAAILDKTREIVLESFSMSEETINDGMDISLLSIKIKSPSAAKGLPTTQQNSNEVHVEWSGANNSLWYSQNGEFKEIKANKFPVGRSYHEGNFTNHTLELSKNDYIILFSDGFADQFGGDKGKKYKYKNLMAFIRESIGNETSFSDLSDKLDREFETWKGKNAQIDDVCVLGIKL